MSYAFVILTTGSLEESRAIAKALLRHKLAAGINIIPPAETYYLADGRVEQNEESVMLVRTLTSSIPGLKELVDQLHSFSAHEITVLEADQISPAYLSWIRYEVEPRTDPPSSS